MPLSTLILAPLLLIRNPGNYPINEENLRLLFGRASEHFEKEIGPVSKPVTISISGADCLRTGYNRKSAEVVFCPNQNVIDSGLQSVDVINHELFHAFLCSYDKDLCQTDEYDYLHEALADIFSYQLNPDRYFGETFYKIHPYIRTYHSTWRIGLVKTAHEKGTALAARFIREEKPLKEIIELFGTEHSREEMEVNVEGRPVSNLNRYRLKAGEVLKLSFQFSASAQVASVKWLTPEGITIEDEGNFQFEMGITLKPAQSKTLVVFLSPEGVELGRQAFYFGPEI
jgi:hypothetical protein